MLFERAGTAKREVQYASKQTATDYCLRTEFRLPSLLNLDGGTVLPPAPRGDAIYPYGRAGGQPDTEGYDLYQENGTFSD